MADLTLATPSTTASPVASDDGDMQAQAHSHDAIPLREAARARFAISLQTFGGPAGQIAVMQRTLVDEKRWIGQQRFLFALCCCTLLNGVRGALVAGILFILLGAPYVERLRGNRSLATALAGITAAVVGVIASLAVYFALQTLFGETRLVTSGGLHVEVPELASIQWAALAITTLGLALVFWRRWSVLRTLGACALAGIVVGLAGAI